MTSWVPVPAGSPFPLANLPYGVFSTAGGPPRIGVAIGDSVLDLAACARHRLVDGHDGALEQPTLNDFMARGPNAWQSLRERVSSLLGDPSAAGDVQPALVAMSEVRLHLPFVVGDYVDFYSSRHHAENLGRILRPGTEPLQPNWRHLPVGYHGRAGTVAVSGTPVRRPHGQRPTFGPSEKLDIEAEVGFVVGTGGERLTPAQFRDHVFGVVLVNDWSARDIQAWEYVPLGPFLGKSFLTSVSPWVVPLAALEAARVPAPRQDPAPLDYLTDHDPWALDLELEVRLNGDVVARPPFKDMYWSPGQQLAHMTVNGATVRPGDLFASGTVSGEARDQWGSFMELTWNGTEGRFLADGDVVTITATAPAVGGGRLGFGEVTGTVVP
jgi:fumarylacetoacetase